MTTTRLEQEQQRVHDVLQYIEQQIQALEQDAGQLRGEVIQIRKFFWEDVTVNKENPDDLLETFISMKQQAEVLSQQERSHRLTYKRLNSLRRLRGNPYFGRILFHEEGMPEAEHIYIGVSTLADESGEHFLIYDWRAPISSVYYDYLPGPATYQTPGGEISGTLEEKWQYLIRDGKIVSMFDTGLTIGDNLLQEVLGRHTDTHMRSIVATIQQEQNQIIRHDRGRLLIVEGAAGSGKTSAALQRIAYLLYTYRNHLRADQIILFSPNAMFNSYVSHVLPELGEENMQQATFQEYLFHRLDGIFEVEDPYAQLEYVLTSANEPDYPVRMAGIRFKASAMYFDAIKQYRQSLEKSGMMFKGLIFRGKPVVSAKEMHERFYTMDTSLRFVNRIEKLAEWLMQKLNQFEKQERSKDWVQDEIELLSNEDYQEIYEQLQRKRGFTQDTFDDEKREREALARVIVRRKLRPLRYRVKHLKFIDVTGMYQQLFADPERIIQWTGGHVPEHWHEICTLTIGALERGTIYYEDATPYLLLKELIEGFQTNVSIQHVLVDEAQDYSAFQFEFLKRLFPAARMTVLGDFNQAIFAHADESADFNPLAGLYGPEETHALRLSRSYRSTKPIVELTRTLVPGGEAIAPFERDGEQPSLTVVASRAELHSCLTEAVHELKSERYESIAIICKTSAESTAAYDALRSTLPELKLITSSSIDYEQGVVIIPAYLAKGIEFDAVLLYDVSDNVYGDESLRRLFYTACTRAMHLLRLYSIGEPTRFLSAAGDLLRIEVKR